MIARNLRYSLLPYTGSMTLDRARIATTLTASCIQRAERLSGFLQASMKSKRYSRGDGRPDAACELH